ncbi:hypothetical protein [Spirosoma koreense]
MRDNLVLRYGLSLLIVLPIGFFLLYPQLLRCMRIGSSAAYRLLPGTNSVYVSTAATASQQRQLATHVATAHHRIRQFWGSRQGQATLIYCPKQADYEQYCAGGEGAGCSLGMPWGASYLVLGPDGNNTDVIAHELCHDELFARLGWWRVKRQIPQWFNEGLALMVDYRFSNPAVWEHPDSLRQTDPTPLPARPMLKLSELETTQDFFGRDYTHTMLAYQTSADEVTRWLMIVGKAGVPGLTQAVASGSSFADIYHQLERAKRTLQPHSLPTN